MKVLYISYWGISDVLTKATVIPNLHLLRIYASRIYLATIERVEKQDVDLPPGVTHIWFRSFKWLPRYFEKAFDFLFFFCRLFWLVKARQIEIVVCRGSMAAAFGVFLYKTARIRFIVESFEPHSDYMVEANTWSDNGIEFRIQKWVEAQTILHAEHMAPVTHSYARMLGLKGVSPERVTVMPCCVEIEKFQFDEGQRQTIRRRIGIPDDFITGIYVGKFGDIYLKEEAFSVFKKAQEIFDQKFFLIILTPQPIVEIQMYLEAWGYDRRFAYVAFVDHLKVRDYLSASDFAFSLIRPSPSRRYCSPIKNGEYWANGLPVLSTSGIGDDEEIIERNDVGVIMGLSPDGVTGALLKMKTLLTKGRLGQVARIASIARNYRSFDIIRIGYEKIMKSEVTTRKKK